MREKTKTNNTNNNSVLSSRPKDTRNSMAPPLRKTACLWHGHQKPATIAAVASAPFSSTKILFFLTHTHTHLTRLVHLLAHSLTYTHTHSHTLTHE